MWTTSLGNEVNQIGERFQFDIGQDAELIRRSARAVDPRGLKPEGFAARRVPEIRGNKANLTLVHTRHLHRNRAHAGRGLKYFHVIHTNDVREKTVQTRALTRR